MEINNDFVHMGQKFLGLAGSLSLCPASFRNVLSDFRDTTMMSVSAPWPSNQINICFWALLNHPPVQCRAEVVGIQRQDGIEMLLRCGRIAQTEIAQRLHVMAVQPVARIQIHVED